MVDSPKVEEFLGVDVGSVRVGMARGNSAARLAEPLKTIPAATSIDDIEKLAAQNSTAAIVVGLPRSLSGNETDQTEVVRQWVKLAQLRIKLPFYWQDEALSSHQAEASHHPQAAGTDAVAAAVILQDFLDSPENDRVAA